ncbi:MAG: riboflavin synthase [Candidatus Eremiobacteraeota bacterium]|nr:riboflavin synthase [Candidatus Eremiobacteraeota bacterium]MBV9700255.1 riboflavin synthase [Candidatus Eremiobacteraeota bacterium]
MFSGIVPYRGKLLSLEPLPEGGARLAVRCEGVETERPQRKDSIAIDGVCLTVTDVAGERVAFDVVPETLARSALAERHAGELVNVEYALRLGDRLGGHFVYGHVDAAARVLLRTREGNGERMRVQTPAWLGRMIVTKGFVALDGVSLTIAAAGREWFEVALVPETLSRTTLGARLPGSHVNLEVDPLARYAQRVEG